MYKRASKLKLRFKIGVGNVSYEDLWDIPMSSLKSVIKDLKKQISQDDVEDLDFLDDEKPKVDEKTQLRFDIAKDIFLTRKAEIESVKNANAEKERAQEIMAIIHEKEKESLKNMSVEDLKKLL